MGCNAWNHASGCNCGWGGQWHGTYHGRNISQTVNDNKINEFYAAYWTYDRRTSYESYVNPNARCPVCGKTVFFYQSEYGGRVFFDELGPPWPKHLCTDNSAVYVPVSYLAPVRAKERNIKWQEKGWEPISILASTVKENLTILKIRRIDSDGMEINLSSEFIYPLSKDALVFIRETDDLGVFEISYLDTLSKVWNIEPQQVIAFRNCYTEFDYTAWRGSLSGNLSDRNWVAKNLLFSNIEKDGAFINLNDEKIDIDAARYWLERAANNGHSLAIKNLKALDFALLKRKLEGNSSLGMEGFSFDDDEAVDVEK
jgi:hypothetical protein